MNKSIRDVVTLYCYSCKLLIPFFIVFVVTGSVYGQTLRVATQDSLALVDLYNYTNGPNWGTSLSGWLEGPVTSWDGIVVESTDSVAVVRSIHINRGNLEGILPESIGNFVGLRELVISERRGMDGPIPNSIGQLSELQTLILDGGGFRGSIPPSLGDLPNIKIIDLSLNQLEGEMPGNILSSDSLEVFDVELNFRLKGKLPDVLGASLYHLVISGTAVEGRIPESYSAFAEGKTEQAVLNLYANKLWGTVPLEFARRCAEIEEYNTDIFVPVPYCRIWGNFGSFSDPLCIPDTPEYRAIGVNPIGGLQLGKDTAGYPCGEEEDPDPIVEGWSDLESLNNKYESRLGSREAAYLHQYLCIVTKACNEYEDSGDNSWGGGFTRFLAQYMDRVPENLSSLNKECPDGYSNLECLEVIGNYHVEEEIQPGMVSYCLHTSDFDEWDKTHDGFLNNTVSSCLQEVVDSGELPFIIGVGENVDLGELLQMGLWSLSDIIIKKAQLTREWVQQQPFCINARQSSNATVSKNNGDLSKLGPEDLIDSLYVNHMPLQIRAENKEFFLPVGSTTKLRVFKKEGDSEVDITAEPGIQFEIYLGGDVASISPEGVLTINSTNVPDSISSSLLRIRVTKGEEKGVGQFAIVDKDTDGDSIVDSYETKIGLNPSVKNHEDSDLDGDNIPDVMEAILRTDPLKADTDGDGISDGDEIKEGSHPLNPDSVPTHTEPRSELPGQTVRTSFYPNPFQNKAYFTLSVSTAQETIIEVYDVLGRRVAVLYQGLLVPTQEHRITFEAGSMSPGVYLVRALGETFSASKKVTLLR